jgi:hypothetical protein
MTDDDSEPTKAELAARVEQLESILYSNRRTVLAGLLGLGGGAALTGSAAAADTSVGAAGAPNGSQDIYLDEILDPTGDPVADLDDTGLFSFQRGLDLPDLQVDGVNNGEPVYADTTEYEIQKDGTDGAGTINFKTN